MSEEVMELREEIDVLKERINVLEKQERNRKTLNYVKLGIRLIIFLAAIYGALKGYEYLSKEVPQLINDKIKEINPSKVIITN